MDSGINVEVDKKAAGIECFERKRQDNKILISAARGDRSSNHYIA